LEIPLFTQLDARVTTCYNEGHTMHKEVDPMEGGEHPRSKNTAIQKGESKPSGCLCVP